MDAPRSETCSAEKNRILKFILYWILENITNNFIRIFGSSALAIEFGDDMIVKHGRHIISRDLDILVSSTHFTTLFSDLSRIGNMILQSRNLFKYSSLKGRKIKEILKYKLVIGGSSSTLFSSYLSFSGVETIEIDIDVVVIDEKLFNHTTHHNGFYQSSIDNILKEWPISDISRGWMCFKSSEGDIILREIKAKQIRLKETLGFLIEFLKMELRRTNNAYNQTCDRYKIISPDKDLLSDTKIGEKKRLELLRSGKTFLNLKTNYILYTFTSKQILDTISVYEKDGTMNSIFKIIFNKIISEEFTSDTVSRIKEQASSCCPICSDEFHPMSNKIILPCGHLYCVGCILPQIIKYLVKTLNTFNDIRRTTYTDDTSDTLDDDLHHNKCPMCRCNILDSIHGGHRLETPELNGIRDHPFNFKTCRIIGSAIKSK